MSTASLHAAVFYREVSETGSVWTIRDNAGFPAPLNSEGKRAQPFWSSSSRAERVVNEVAAYSGFSVVEISWETFRDRWIPGLTRDAILVGVNWSGSQATGYDVEPHMVLRNVRGFTDTSHL